MKTKLREQLEVLLNEFLTTSTCHGLPNIARSKYWIVSLLWVICLLASSITCCVFVVFTIIQYLNYDVVTTIRVDYKTPIEFPTIKVCPLQPFSTEEGAKFVERVLMANDLDEIINFQSQTNSSNFFTKLMAARYVACNNVLDSSYSNTQRQDLGQSNEEMLLRCTWNGKECSPDRLSWSYDIYHGNCISFNDAPNSTTKEFLKTAKTGKIGGLEMELLFYSNDSLNTLSYANGAHVYIYNSSGKPSPNSDGLDISAGTDTSIILDVTRINKLVSPYSDCLPEDQIKQSRYFTYLNQMFGSYKQRNCFDLCYQSRVIKSCKCYDPAFSNMGQSTICSNISQVECFLDISSNMPAYISGCLDYCPMECNFTNFGFSIAMTDYPSEIYAKMMQSNYRNLKLVGLETASIQELKKHVLSLHVFYDVLGYTQIEEMASMAMYDLVSGIGGTLGFYVGVSMLSIVEIFELIFHIVLIVWQTKTNEKTQPG